MRKRLRFFAAVTALALCSYHIIAQETGESFARDLTNALKRDGWSQTEIEEMNGHLAQYDLEGLGEANPEAIALALSYGRETSSGTFSVQEAAMTAVQLGKAAREMSQLGYGDRQIAQAALQGMRLMLRQNQGINTTDQGGVLQTQIRKQARASDGSGLQIRLRQRPVTPAVAPSIQMRLGPPAQALPPGIGAPNPDAPGSTSGDPGQTPNSGQPGNQPTGRPDSPQQGPQGRK